MDHTEKIEKILDAAKARLIEEVNLASNAPMLSEVRNRINDLKVTTWHLNEEINNYIDDYSSEQIQRVAALTLETAPYRTMYELYRNLPIGTPKIMRKDYLKSKGYSSDEIDTLIELIYLTEFR